MNNRDVFLLVIVEQALAMGIFLFEVWMLTRKNRESRPKVSIPENEVGSTQPYLVSVNRLPRAAEPEAAPLASADEEALSANAQAS